ncbi:hypothetical protein HNR03_001504 [Pseudomonas sp. JAI111]|uniref:hypothetical protein n=1 Tax=Pseudomonas sp. JAI111 TaxID=2735913 RepID=UPI00216922C6|nr:hypothetical protein [Pseudomonas sp. JAI111]MCS3836924.1 hypothetical protein [Pseudomonas sp. JAI111]
MTNYLIEQNKTFNAVSGALKAEIQKFGTYDGKATYFLTNETDVYLYTLHQTDEKNWMVITFLFPANIENKRHEFYENSPIEPPSFSLRWIDEGGRTWFRPYYSRLDAGHIDIKFNLAEGTLNASFNFTFKDKLEERQVVGQMLDIKGLAHVKYSFEGAKLDK